MTTLDHSPFKAYDLRGRVPESLNVERAHAIGQAYVDIIQPQGPVVVGRDMRLSSPELSAALIEGLQAAGSDTIDIGLVGTELVYHAASRAGMGGGIMVTASHNPADYNGMKMVRERSIPISADTGLKDIEAVVAKGQSKPAAVSGRGGEENVLNEYVQRLQADFDLDALRPMKLVVNAGNGCAGPSFDALAAGLPFEIQRLHHNPDGTFPNGVPNPLLPENRSETSDAVRATGADFGVAWDGDFDRCFFFDESGRFIEGYYLVGLFAASMLERHPGQAIVLDPRLTWNTLDQVERAGGRALINKSGHAFIKERMRREDALYGGEMSAHHYFRDFAYCDSGMLPWLLMGQILSEHDQTLGEMLDDRIRAFPCSGEINFSVEDTQRTIDTALAHYQPQDPVLDRTDGISLEFAEWRFNLRASNTEPVIRLNVETRANPALLDDKVGELSALIQSS
ncbi:MAG: phosphomannomutase [Pseudomonadota bacterium]